MPTAAVEHVEVHGADDVWKNQPVREDELWVDFEVSVAPEPGCCALFVTVYHAHLWPFPDEVVAENYRLAPYPCLCVTGTPQRFRIYADAPGPPVQKPVGVTLLDPPLHGVWPKSDGPADNTLELYAKVEVVWCNEPCPGAGQPCRGIDERKGFVTIGESDSSDRKKRVTIVDGTGWEEFWRYVLMGLGFLFAFVPMPKPGGKASGRRPRRARRRG